jgi:hypothetical protein
MNKINEKEHVLNLLGDPINNVGFEVFTAVTLKNEVFWVEEITLSLARGIKTVTVL